MLMPLRLALCASGLVASAQLLAATELVQLRGGVGVYGRPQQLSGIIDANGNGRAEILVAGRWHISFVEEDPGPRGYRETARLDSPDGASFDGAMLVDVPGEEPALLLRWSQQLELRDIASLQLKARLAGNFGGAALGDVDGDGSPEIVIGGNFQVRLLDPVTLASRGVLALPIEGIAVADIVGDTRAEIISNEARAYTVTRVGSDLSAIEVWNAGLSDDWNPYVVDVDGHAAIVLHGYFGYEAKLATFYPTTALQTLVPPIGAQFRPVLADANSDGHVDLITASSSEVRALDIPSGATLWERDTIYQAPYIGAVFYPIAIDLDANGVVELVWTDGSTESGIVAISAPLAGSPRWRSDFNQTRITDWTLIRKASGKRSIGYLTGATRVGQRLSTIGLLDVRDYTDQGGSALSWLPGYNGVDSTILQHAITALSPNGLVDQVVVSGAEYPPSGVNPLAKWLWTFDATGALLGTRALNSSIDPERVATAQVLNRPERQLIVAGRMPQGTSGPPTSFMRVEVVDYATGNVLWQSVALPTFSGASATKLEVVDLDADGVLEVIFAYGENVTILKPSATTNVIADHIAVAYSLLDRGVGQSAKVATLTNVNVAVYDGLSATPEKTFVLPSAAICIALFREGPAEVMMFATSGYGGTTVQRYADGGVVATNTSFQNTTLVAEDVDGDDQIELIGSDLNIWRLDQGVLFRNGFDSSSLLQ